MGPANYSIEDVFSPKTNSARRSARFTFGVSRDEMKKDFVEECIKQAPLSPAPNSYRDPPKFGDLGSKPFMRPKLHRQGQREENYSEYYLSQQKKLPGPGFYQQMDVLGAVVPNSSIRSQRMNVFSKAEDRFKDPKQQSPAASTYSPRNGMLQDVDASKTRAPVAKFNKN